MNRLIKLQLLFTRSGKTWLFLYSYRKTARGYSNTNSFFNKTTMSELEGNYLCFDDFWGELISLNVETVLSNLYLSVLQEGKLLDIYKNKIYSWQ